MVALKMRWIVAATLIAVLGGCNEVSNKIHSNVNFMPSSSAARDGAITYNSLKGVESNILVYLRSNKDTTEFFVNGTKIGEKADSMRILLPNERLVIVAKVEKYCPIIKQVPSDTISDGAELRFHFGSHNVKRGNKC